MADIAALLRDVDIDDDESLDGLLSDSGAISFVLEALRRVREHFGPDATVSLSTFVEPDYDGPPAHHFTIETALAPADACEAFERFCLQWWDDTAAESGVALHPILDVAR